MYVCMYECLYLTNASMLQRTRYILLLLLITDDFTKTISCIYVYVSMYVCVCTIMWCLCVCMWCVFLDGFSDLLPHTPYSRPTACVCERHIHRSGGDKAGLLPCVYGEDPKQRRRVEPVGRPGHREERRSKTNKIILYYATLYFIILNTILNYTIYYTLP